MINIFILYFKYEIRSLKTRSKANECYDNRPTAVDFIDSNYTENRYLVLFVISDSIEIPVKHLILKLSAVIILKFFLSLLDI